MQKSKLWKQNFIVTIDLVSSHPAGVRTVILHYYEQYSQP